MKYVKIYVEELEALILEATDGVEIEDLSFDAIWSLRDSLTELLEDPNRRTNG